MSRLLYLLSYPAPVGCSAHSVRFGLPPTRAPTRSRTADLVLTKDALYLLSYRGESCKTSTQSGLNISAQQDGIQQTNLSQRQAGQQIIATSLADDAPQRTAGTWWQV